MKKVLLLIAISVIAFADMLETKTSNLNGMFSSFSQNRIHFQTWEGEIADTLDPSRVTSMTLTPPATVNLYTTRQPKAPQEVKLRAFSKLKFVVEDADGVVTEIPYRQVNRIERHIDMNEFMRKRKYANSPEGDTIRVTDLLESGVATVIHFHADGNAESEARGEFCKNLCKESSGLAVYKRVVVSGPTDPLVKRYKLESMPQFWFFTSKKAVSARLIDKTEETDIEEALKKALGK